MIKFCSQTPRVLAINRSLNDVTMKNKGTKKNIKINLFHIVFLNKIDIITTVIIVNPEITIIPVLLYYYIHIKFL